MKRNENIVVNSVITGIGDTVVSLLAALAIIPIMFSLLPHDQVDVVLSSGNTGLTFIWIPQLFQKIEGGYLLMLLL